MSFYKLKCTNCEASLLFQEIFAGTDREALVLGEENHDLSKNGCDNPNVQIVKRDDKSME